MKLESQVCSLEWAKKLKELNCKQDSLWCWTPDIDNLTNYYLAEAVNPLPKNKPYYSAFTVAELGEMLPKYVTSEKCNFKNGFFVESEDEVHNTLELTEANARAKMVAYLLEQGIIKSEELKDA